MFTSPRDEVQQRTVAPREGCTFLILLRRGEGAWHSELAHMLLDAPYTMCYMSDETTCRRYWEKTKKGTLVMACNSEVARFVGTLPFFASLRSLRMCGSMLMPLSACKLLTYVCVSTDPRAWGDTEAEVHSTTTKMAEILRELPALCTLRLSVVSDPSIITDVCSPSLVSFKCDSCTTCEHSMPHLERFMCHLCGFHLSNMERIAAALRGCVALRAIFIKYADYSFFETLITLPLLKEAILPCYFRSEDGVWNSNGTIVTRGVVCQLITGTHEKCAGELVLLLPALSYLLRVRALNLAARVAGIGHGMPQWMVFSAPSSLFTQIWGALRKISTSESMQHEDDDVMYGAVL